MNTTDKLKRLMEMCKRSVSIAPRYYYEKAEKAILDAEEGGEILSA